MLGDDRGLTVEDEAEIERRNSEAVVFRVSLGRDVLFTNQCVVLVNHYLDRILHSCAIRPPRKMRTK